MQKTTQNFRMGTCHRCSAITSKDTHVNLQNNVQQVSHEQSVNTVTTIVEVQESSQEPPTEQATEIGILGNLSSEQCSQPMASEIQVSKLDANEYLQWQWEKLMKRLADLDERCPDGSGMSISELTEIPSTSSPLVISEEALRLHAKAKELGCPEWANKFLLLIGHRILTISRGPLFLSMTQEEVCEILSSDHLDVDNERNVLRAAHRWLDHAPLTRSSSLAIIMGCVRYGLMAKEDIIKCVVTRRHLRTCILNLPPFQRALTNGLIWLCMLDLGVEANFPEFEQLPRIHQELSTDKDHYEGPPRTRNLRGERAKNRKQTLECEVTDTRGIQVVSNMTATATKAGPSGCHHLVGRTCNKS